MRTTGTRIGVALLCAAFAASAVTWRSPVYAAPADVAKYHTYQELSAALKAAAATHPDLVRLVSIGKTKEGRDIWAVEIANPKGTPVESRPALLVAANLEGDHVIGSELALYAVDYLPGAYPADAAVKQRLDTSVIYVLPRVNPDGAELMFAPVKALRRTNATAFDADNDARMDEDGPEDLNKDGVVTVMRVKDPKGPYMISPEDARLMKRADPAKGESGGWAIYPEGIDNDGDGFINEDGPGGVDINRNFMHQYPYFAADAGRYMVSEAETRAVLDFVLKHRNIAAILTFGESDNLIAGPARPGPAAGINLVDFAERSFADARRVGVVPEMGGGFGRGFGRGGAMFGEGVPPGGPGGPGGRGAQATAPSAGGRGMRSVQTVTMVNHADVEYLNAIAAKYRELTGLRSAGYTRAPAGAFYEYGYYQFGVPSFSTPGWGLPGGARPFGGGAPPGDAAGRMGGGAGVPAAAVAAGFGQRGGGRGAGGAAADADATAEGIDVRLLQWMDAEKVDGFVNWTPFKHPTLGDVEIGGFKPYVTVNPPAAKIAELGASHAKFIVYLASIFSNVRIAGTSVTALGGGLFRIKADVENTGFLPTALAQAVTARSVKPLMVQLGVPPESIITGAEKTSSIQSLAGSGSRQSYEWVIKGQPGASITLLVQSQKSGTDRATIALR